VLDAFVPAARERGHDKLEVENALDGAVRKRQEESTRTSAGTAAVRLPDIEPWPEAVEAAAVFRELCRCIRCHVVLGTARLIGVAFWVLHVHFLSIATYCPRLSVSSPRMRCGKTTLLRVIGELTPRPLNGENMSPAVLYHLAERLQPCFLLDEIDNQLAASNPDRKALLGLINSGHERNGKVWRMSGEGAAMVPVAYKTFSPMALAGIGRLSGPTGDRCIHIPLERRLPGERAERFDYENLQPLHDCRAKLARLALDTLDTAKAARPVLPAVLNDRQVDNWRLAFRIAEVAGRGWPAMLRKAAISLSQGSDDEDDQAVQLLADCRAVHDAVVFNFDGWIKSISLLAELRLMEERPWNTYGRSEKPMTAAQLARLLRLFGIRSADHDFAARPNRDVVKGYEWRKFEDAWRRYVPVTPQTQPLPRYHVDFIDI
jgi:hypothetical protein